MRDFDFGNLAPAQAVELAQLVDLEARWENLRTTAVRAPQAHLTTQDLQGKQKAYEAFRAKLAAYNKRYAPAHVPELLLNTPVRLGIWCRAMRDLFSRVAHEPQVHYPAHLLEKAYRWADRVAGRLSKDRVERTGPPGDLESAVRELDALSRWCTDLAKLAAAG